MLGLWLENQKLELRQSLVEPLPKTGEALIRVCLAGICSTDLELLKGYYPYSGIPGHEFVGEVVNAPSETGWQGKRVVGEINIACGQCEMCRGGLDRHCEHRRTLGIHDWNGAFASFLVLPLANLHEVPGGISDQAAVFTEPLAAACEILQQVAISQEKTVLVIGAGRLGHLVAQVLQTTGCRLEVVARYPHQRRILTSRHIHTLSKASLGSKKYDIVIEATGSPSGLLLARQSIKPRGTIILKSTYKGEIQFNFSRLVVDEISLIGSRCGSFEPALELLARAQVDPVCLIEETYSLDQGLEAFSHAGRSGALKVLIQPG
jgi:2-desacetyl-2-hydroxyethyl bacteriochlorophyllide A dehydrogenase